MKGQLALWAVAMAVAASGCGAIHGAFGPSTPSVGQVDEALVEELTDIAAVEQVDVAVGAAGRLSGLTMRHLDVMAKVILGISCLMGYAYLMEGVTAWYSMNEFIHHAFAQYVTGTYWWAGWTAIVCNILIPQIFWVPKFRRSYLTLIFVAAAVTVGMWFERFVIIISSLHQDFLPSSWHDFIPTPVDFGILLGSFGLFFTLVLLFARVLPVVSTTEVKAFLPGAQPTRGEGPHE